MRTAERLFVDKDVGQESNHAENRISHQLPDAFAPDSHQRYVWQAKGYSMPKDKTRRFRGGELRMLPRPYLLLPVLLVLLIAII